MNNRDWQIVQWVERGALAVAGGACLFVGVALRAWPIVAAAVWSFVALVYNMWPRGPR